MLSLVAYKYTGPVPSSRCKENASYTIRHATQTRVLIPTYRLIVYESFSISIHFGKQYNFFNPLLPSKDGGGGGRKVGGQMQGIRGYVIRRNIETDNKH